MNDLLFSLNIVLPLLLLVVIGYTLSKTSLFSHDFYSSAEKFVFKVSLPTSLFMSIYNADPGGTFDGKFIIFCVAFIFISFIIPCLVCPFIIKDKAKTGAFIQGVFRSNYAILGLPIAERLFSDIGTATAVSVMPFSIPLFNIFAVIILSIFAPGEKKMTFKEITLKSVKGIITNPLIIGIALGLPFMITGLRLPSSLTTTLKYVGNVTTPLALICLGASMSKKDANGRVGLASIAAIIKTAVLPAIVLTVAVLMGFRGVQLGVIFILFGGPTAVSSYIMAKNMGSDHKLAGQILLISTVLCSLTMFAGIYILKHFALI